jgi:hypothetical protein
MRFFCGFETGLRMTDDAFFEDFYKFRVVLLVGAGIGLTLSARVSP